jgi:hypothetical protein
MSPKRILALGALTACLGLTSPSLHAADVTGTVREHGSLTPMAGAIVTLQTTTVRTTTAADGTFTLDAPAGSGLVIVGAQKGFFNQAATVSAPSSGVDILLMPVPQDADPNYSIQDPAVCGNCHFDQLVQWFDSPMANGGVNTWVHDIYSGTATPGGMGGFVYLNDSAHAGSNPDSECASCHQPEEWIGNGFSGPMDPNIDSPSLTVEHGVSCDICHKIADVDVSKINFPGLHPDAVTYTQPVGVAPNQVQYGLLGDVDFNLSSFMRASYQPQLEAEVCAVCHQDKNDPDGNEDFEEPNGIISEPTYLEWANSPYGDKNSPLYLSCVDCHMPSTGATQVCSVLFPPLVRDPSTIRSHTILGTTPEYLENAVELDMRVRRRGADKIRVDVDITNSLTGHHVPTGVTIRNMILLVEAWEDGQDPLTNPLTHLGTQTVHDLGGIGDPEFGYYAGLPGKYFSKVNHDGTSGPTFFTDAVGITFDNRIPALATDSTAYVFAGPPGGGLVHVRARLIYRRSFRFLTDAKGWTEDGHGNPLADVIAPHYGHLMEMEQSSISVGDVISTGPLNKAAPGVPSPPTSPPVLPTLVSKAGVLQLRDATDNAPVKVGIGTTRPPRGATWQRFVGGFETDDDGALDVAMPRTLGGVFFAQAYVLTESGYVATNAVLVRPAE